MFGAQDAVRQLGTWCGIPYLKEIYCGNMMSLFGLRVVECKIEDLPTQSDTEGVRFSVALDRR